MKTRLRLLHTIQETLEAANKQIYSLRYNRGRPDLSTLSAILEKLGEQVKELEKEFSETQFLETRNKEGINIVFKKD